MTFSKLIPLLVIVSFALTATIFGFRVYNSFYQYIEDTNSRISAVGSILEYSELSTGELWHLLGFLKDDSVSYFQVQNRTSSILLEAGVQEKSEYLHVSSTVHIEKRGLRVFKVEYTVSLLKFGFKVLKSDFYYLSLLFIMMAFFVSSLPLALFFESKKNRELIDAISFQSRKVAHDINSPLTALQLAHSRIADGHPTKEIMKAATKRIRGIVEDLNFGGNVEDSKSVDRVLVNEVLERVVSEKELEYSTERDIQINLLVPERQYYCRIAAGDLERVFSNLINNAVEAKGSKKLEIKIGIYLEKKIVLIRFQDNGVGIPSSVLQKIRKGHRISFGKRRTFSQGMGIGLISSKSALEKVGGHIFIESKESLGTSISIKLPLVDV